VHIQLLKSGDDLLHIEAVLLLNDKTISVERSRMLLAEPCYFFLVALDDSGEIMGRIYGNVIHRPEQTDLLLYEVDVLEQHHKKGAGTAMIERVKALMLEQGYKEAWVLTEGDNKRARAFYESVGGVLEAFPTAMYVFRGMDE
jgi:GNAT superfamily N-acetyltransferase